MRLSAWFPLAALSLSAICAAATRPHYGGTLRVEMRAAPASLDPASPDAARLDSLTFEPLIRLDANGMPQPWLAASWQHDAACKHWQIALRPPVTPAAVESSLEALLPGMLIAATREGITIRSDRPAPDLLLDLAGHPIAARSPEGAWLATGPFRLATFEPGHRALFVANSEYWGGRPYVDSIEVLLGRPLRDQLVDLEVGKSDIVEIAPADVRRVSVLGRSVWESVAINLVVLSFASGHADNRALREALALAIDRAAMHNVLLQKQGEITAALLPQWLSGYAFAFSSTPDLSRARAVSNRLPPATRGLVLSYEPSLSWARAVAERVAVNAGDVGIPIQVAPRNPQADLRLLALRLPSLGPATALAGFAAALQLGSPAPAPTVLALYEAERKLLDGFRAIPLFVLPDFYGVDRRVRAFPAPPLCRLGEWRFDNIWLEGNAP
jgi:ABC-type transport system substrate-binding protein